MQSEDEETKLESAISEVSAMEKQSEENSVLKSNSVSDGAPKADKGLSIVTIFLALLAFFGIGISVYVMTDENTKIATINNDINDLRQQVAELKDKDEKDQEDTEEEEGEDNLTYGKPNSIDEIELISISYNGYRDFINIAEDGIDYYSDDGTKVIRASEKGLDTDTSEIMQYVFDNQLGYLTESEGKDDFGWSLEVYTISDKVCMISGTGENPEWFEELLNKLNVSEYGNYSIKNP